MMRNVLTILGLLVTASVVACSTPADDASAQGQTSDISEAESHASAIIWTQAQEKVTQYVDEQGHVVSHRLGVEIAAGSAVLRLKATRSDAPLLCSVNYGNGAQDWNGKYQGYGLSLTSSSGLPEQVMVPLAPMPADNEYSSLSQGADITGSVGSFLFIHETADEMGCGAAHGNRSVKAFTWDSARGAAGGISTFAPDAVLAKAKEAFAGRGFAGGGPESEPKLVELIPRFDAAGNLSLAYRFEKGDCYACSDRVGSDYTISTTVEGSAVGAELPFQLKELASPPPAVTAYLAANPGVTINGWSKIGH
jgi:hypothetical protein